MTDSEHVSGLTAAQVRAGATALRPIMDVWSKQEPSHGVHETWRLLRLTGWAELAAFECGDVDEVQALRLRGHAIQYVQDAEQAVRAAADALGQRGHYVVPALLRSGLEATTDLGLWNRAKSTAKERDVVRSLLLVVDCDPQRPSNTSSTKTEWIAAIGTAGCVLDLLRRAGVGEGALGAAHSGNGAHVHLYLDVPWSKEVKLQRERILKALGVLCRYEGQSASIKIDPSMADGARYVPLYGTMKRKGGRGHDDRPWRRTAVTGPANVVPLDFDALSRLADTLETLCGTEAQPSKVAVQSSQSRTLSQTAPRPNAGNVDARIERYVAKCSPAISGEQGHKAAFRTICNVVRGFGLDADQAVRALDPWNSRCSPPWSERELRHKVKDALESGQRPEIGAFLKTPKRKGEATTTARDVAEAPTGHKGGGDRGVPDIVLGVDTDRVIADAVAALAKDPDVYSRGTALVRAIPTDDGLETFELPASVLRLIHLARSAGWWIERKGELVKAKAPSDVANAVHQLQTWNGVRPLVNIVDVPVMRADGTVLDQAGYDHGTRLLYVPVLDFGEIAAEPSRDDAIAARDRVLEIVKDFPMLESARAAWLALVLSYCGRPMYHGPTPGFVLDANVRGCGKGLLADVTGLVCVGARLPVTTPTLDEDELRKRITSTLMRGKGVVLVDNLPNDGELGNATWDRLLTGSRWEDRVLGSNQLVTVPNATLWVFTANNVQIRGDTSRRIIHIRLETSLEYPEHRRPQDFTHSDLLAYVEERRVSFVRDILTMLRAWVVAGRPRGNVSLGSFEGWCATVGACVEWLGMGDVTLTQAEYRKRSAAGGGDATPLRPLMASWRRAFGSTEVTATVLLRALHDEDERLRREQRRLERASRVLADDDGTVGLDAVESSDNSHRYQDLRDAVLTFAPGRNGLLPAAISLGRKLSGALRRVVDGHRFEGREDRDGVTHWRLVAIDAAALGLGPERGGFAVDGAGDDSDRSPASRPGGIALPNDSCGGCGGNPASPESEELATSTETDMAENALTVRHELHPPHPPHQRSSSIETAANSAGVNPSPAPAASPAQPPQPEPQSPESDAAFVQFLIESV